MRFNGRWEAFDQGRVVVELEWAGAAVAVEVVEVGEVPLVVLPWSWANDWADRIAQRGQVEIQEDQRQDQGGNPSAWGNLNT